MTHMHSLLDISKKKKKNAGMIPEIKVHKKVLSDIVGMKQYLVKRRDVLLDYYMKFSIIDTIITPDFNIGLRASPNVRYRSRGDTENDLENNMQ